MSPLLEELSQLEAEVLEIVASASEPSQDRNQEILTTVECKVGVVAVLAGEGTFPVDWDKDKNGYPDYYKNYCSCHGCA